MTETRQRSRLKWLPVGMVFSSVPILGPALLLAQSVQPVDPAIAESFRALGEQVDGLDWDKEYPHIERALQNIWAQNGWNDEADQAALELVHEVAAIPPWQFMKRLDVLGNRLGERYGMNEHQEARLKGMILREVGGLLMHHAGAVFEQAGEALRMRARGEPYTPERVAQWMKAAEPVRAEAQLAGERLISRLETMLTPEGRRILERDAGSYRKRLKYFDEMATRWARGEWQPSDWGLQSDPIQCQAIGSRVVDRQPPVEPPGASITPPNETMGRWVAHDPSTWLAYLTDFKQRFKLDPGQVTALESIHAEMVERANGYVRAHAEELENIAGRERSAHEAYEPVRTLFREMQERFDAVPTSAQRGQNDS